MQSSERARRLFSFAAVLGIWHCPHGPVRGETPAERPAGQKIDIRVSAEAGEYASFPQLARTDRELVLLFQVQDFDRLAATGQHPHYQPVASLRWAVSRDGGRQWDVVSQSPELGPVRDISYGSAPRADGGTVTLSFHNRDPLQAILQNDRLVYRPYQTQEIETGEILPVEDLGPLRPFAPYGMLRRSDGVIIASGYGTIASADGAAQRGTVAFLSSHDEGRTWRYMTHLTHDHPFDFSETALMETSDGRLLALLRADWDLVPLEQRPTEARNGYGYFLYRTESHDGGSTWSEPEPTTVWGHPPHLTRLASGQILLVYGHRREPYEIRAILSRDEGRTWDEATQRTVYRFEPGDIDFGYPVATQLEDGTIVCAYYGYLSDQVAGNAPRGIFVSLFDEQWLAAASPPSLAD